MTAEINNNAHRWVADRFDDGPDDLEDHWRVEEEAVVLGERVVRLTQAHELFNQWHPRAHGMGDLESLQVSDHAEPPHARRSPPRRQRPRRIRDGGLLGLRR